MLRLSICFCIALLLLCAPATAWVVTYSAPQGERLSLDYKVETDGHPVDVYAAKVNEFPHDKLDFGGDYSFVQFDFSGTIQVRIYAPNRSLEHTVVRAVSKPVPFTLIDPHTIIVTLLQPCLLSVESEGKRRPLLVFANPLEENVPRPGDPNVVYFGPGVHRPQGGIIEVKSNQTLYIAGGAVVEGAIVADGAENVIIRGRGILSGNAWRWAKGPSPQMVTLRKCRNVTVEGLILRGSWAWTLVPIACEDVRITNTKICNGRVNNDDGINPCNSRHVVIRGCFVRTDDDCIALKGLKREWGNVEDVQIENTLLWCDRARITLLGHESQAEKMEAVVFRNLSIIHFGEWPVFLLEPGENMQLHNILFENILINGEGQDKFAIIRPIINQFMQEKTCGHIRNVTFKDVDLEGMPGKYQILIEGCAEGNRTSGLSFQNVSILGNILTEDSMRVVFGHNRENYVEMDTIKFTH
jgi:hypothetical protein